MHRLAFEKGRYTCDAYINQLQSRSGRIYTARENFEGEGLQRNVLDFGIRIEGFGVVVMYVHRLAF